MRKTFTPLMVAFILVAAALVCGCTDLQEDGDQNQPAAGMPVDEDLMPVDEILVQDGNFSTFVQALGASRLEGLLAGQGPYTVFAPTDEAFDRLQPGTLDELMMDPKGNLAEILLYHVVPPGEDPVSGGGTIVTVQGSPIIVDTTGEGMTVNGARVIQADIPAANGVIYAIDTVLIPPDITLPVINETDG
ncbi:MAG TPA: fasciclin domain-containing protein [Candidatus Methanoculleus thermohydrogenotrophicum]|jgi:uncharacterized surface protein with fasciclin (FAS1) repeats|nr:fasciclin domain-containing protein [Candidatus Methanoculleus thermohydrogenotrophicum]HOB18001.1 fasciclin domain-containing protein [Candidatus Methanoculleus thermohydrogenotrophicum]HPZ38231.1 fasciclin domain-containing protein [Candidatus Methanoculleus thermohydrogenotrophicum]HQC91358.1 fasciclin domain-containing protein [Candidatus Methanoculleus thermohydrogenotrophicum]